MGLLLYKKQLTSEGEAILSEPVPIKMSGKEGLIATYVQKNRETKDLDDWTLKAEAIPCLLGYDSGDYMVCFSSKNFDTKMINLSEVIAFQGRCELMRTDAVLMHRNIAAYPVDAFPDTLTIHIAMDAESIIEPFGLSGGTANSKSAPSTWALTAPQMHIGGVIV
jgi:hypothetical protein